MFKGEVKVPVVKQDSQSNNNDLSPDRDKGKLLQHLSTL